MNDTAQPAASSLMPVPAKPSSELATMPATAATAQAKAAVEARYLVALRRPRNWDTARVQLLAACRRPTFAEAARYRKPIAGTSVAGLSIRFAEEALRVMTNVDARASAYFEDDEQRILRVSVTDLESNVSYSQDVAVKKVVERSTVREGQTVLGERTNRRGKTVYLVEATEDEVLTKQQALVSKTLRTLVLRMLPSDLREEAEELCTRTVQNQDAQDPASARKLVCDAFYRLGVDPSELEQFLGHKLEQTTRAELQQLREIRQAITEGETSWATVMDQRGEAPAAPLEGAGQGKQDSRRLHETPAAPDGQGHAAAGAPEKPTSSSGAVVFDAAGHLESIRGKPIALYSTDELAEMLAQARAADRTRWARLVEALGEELVGRDADVRGVPVDDEANDDDDDLPFGL